MTFYINTWRKELLHGTHLNVYIRFKWMWYRNVTDDSSRFPLSKNCKEWGTLCIKCDVSSRSMLQVTFRRRKFTVRKSKLVWDLKFPLYIIKDLRLLSVEMKMTTFKAGIWVVLEIVWSSNFVLHQCYRDIKVPKRSPFTKSGGDLCSCLRDIWI